MSINNRKIARMYPSLETANNNILCKLQVLATGFNRVINNKK